MEDNDIFKNKKNYAEDNEGGKNKGYNSKEINSNKHEGNKCNLPDRSFVPSNINNITGNNLSVSDREIMRIIKEQKIFPQTFSKRVKLSKIVEYYYKLWNNDFTDDSVESDTDEIK